MNSSDPRDGIQHAAVDKPYGRNTIRAKLDGRGNTLAIPPKIDRLDLIGRDRERYQQRHKVERLFNKIN